MASVKNLYLLYTVIVFLNTTVHLYFASLYIQQVSKCAWTDIIP